MVEIALCLGIIAIALVAIIGVLPTGLRVQRQNLQDTILNQDGMYLVETIRSGSVAADELTNYVLSITWSNSAGALEIWTNTYGYTAVTPPEMPLTTGARIVHLLSIPKYWEIDEDTIITNRVTGFMRSMAGSAEQNNDGWRTSDRWPLSLLPDGLVYQVTSEVVPLSVLPRDMTNFTAYTGDESAVRSNRWMMARNLAANFHELRLTLAGPVYQVGTELRVGNKSKTFRTMLPGIQEPYVTSDDVTNWLFRAKRFVRLAP